jgi:hypothetical protein
VAASSASAATKVGRVDRLAKHDADYLRWLSRHSSGLRYKAEIEYALKTVSSEPTFSERLRGRD